MFDPKDILTEDGVRKMEGHLFNIEEALFYILNHADDLHIGALDGKQLDTLYAMETLLPTLRTGDGELPG
jgi:hypothetical protein